MRTVFARPLTLVAATLTATLALSACGSSSDSQSAPTTAPGQAAADGQFPVKVTHAFGETTIEKKPERVAAIGWGNQDVALSLGVVPVGMSKATWGDDNKNGIHPWAEAKIKELGGQTPVLFDDTDSIDYEAVANTAPDVILAAYSGLTKEQYDKLSQIAPVVAYPKTAWATSMADMVKLDSQGLGRAADGEKLLAGARKQITDVAAKHPSLKGKVGVVAPINATDLSKVTVYNELDPRQQLLTQLGMVTPKAVAATASTNQFFATLSAEQVDKLADAQVFVSYTKNQTSDLKAAKASPLWSKLAPVKNDAIAFVPDDSPLASVATTPTPLNLSWGLDKYATLLDAAAAKAT